MYPIFLVLALLSAEFLPHLFDDLIVAYFQFILVPFFINRDDIELFRHDVVLLLEQGVLVHVVGARGG